MAPICTDFLLVQLRLLNETEALQNAVSFPGEIDLKMQHIGREELGSWGDNFCQTAVVLGNVVPVDTINLSYNTLEPRFAIWLDAQTAADFRCGDVPAYYQKMNTPQALNSVGAPIQVNYGAAVMATPLASQQPLSDALVTLWGTAAPLLPSSYFTGSVVQIQQTYLQALRQNTNDFATHRLNAAFNDIGRW
ncbi:hypothetical protein [Burkholderia glumae]|nr:hypothetical protein [Burkholderia glumae]UVS97069.1 hypothetical protein EFP19_15845 [Burkholderia glumae]